MAIFGRPMCNSIRRGDTLRDVAVSDAKDVDFSVRAAGGTSL
jgi:hypothetical protein